MIVDSCDSRNEPARSPQNALAGPIKSYGHRTVILRLPKAMARRSCGRLATCQQFPDGYILVTCVPSSVCFISIAVFRRCLLYHHSGWLNMDPDQFADGSSLIRAHRVCFYDKIVWSAIENMHLTWTAYMHFEYIKCWLDKGFNKLDKINKKSRYFWGDL